MTYSNITCSSVGALHQKVQNDWVKSDETNCFKKHVLARGAHLTFAPASCITNAIDIIIGLGVSTCSILTLGLHRRTFVMGCNHLAGARLLLPHFYANILRAINPKSAFPQESATSHPTIRYQGDGFVAHLITKDLRKVAAACAGSDNCLEYYVASRLIYLSMPLVSLIGRVADAIIGPPAVALSILSLGYFDSLNNLAYRTLQAPGGIITDLFYNTIKFINPWAGNP